MIVKSIGLEMDIATIEQAVKRLNLQHEDYRHECGRLLFRGYLAPGTVYSTRCPKCGKFVFIRVDK